MAWGLLPIYFSEGGLSIGAIGVLAALYPAVWSLAQLAAGPVSDGFGRKWMIASGMGLQAFAIAVLAATGSFAPWAAASIVLGLGTAMVYPVLLAAIGDVADPAWRASAIGAYRAWRDLGFVAGALLCGLVADAAGPRAAIYTVAALTALSGIVVAARMYETHPRVDRGAA
jgi:MFS family permease